MHGDSQIDITQILKAASEGDQAAAGELLPLVYEELRKLAKAHMARQKPGHTLQATALVHEAYLRLVGDQAIAWQSRGHFFATAALAMRRILVDRARRRSRLRRGGDRKRVEMFELPTPTADEPDPDELLAVDEALTRLETLEPRRARVVTLRYFGGLTIDETAKAIGVATPTVERDWQFAKAWLHRELKGD